MLGKFDLQCIILLLLKIRERWYCGLSDLLNDCQISYLLQCKMLFLKQKLNLVKNS